MSLVWSPPLPKYQFKNNIYRWQWPTWFAIAQFFWIDSLITRCDYLSHIFLFLFVVQATPINCNDCSRTDPVLPRARWTYLKLVLMPPPYASHQNSRSHSVINWQLRKSIKISPILPLWNTSHKIWIEDLSIVKSIDIKTLYPSSCKQCPSALKPR